MIGTREASRAPSPTLEEAFLLVQSALANRDPAKVKEFFRLGRSSINEVLSFCEGLEKSDGKFSECQWLSSIDSPQASLEGVVVKFVSADFTTRQRLALLTPDSDGHWKVDFEAFARVVTPSWEEILKPGGKAALVRVMLAPDYYYNGPFQDETKWTSYGMSSPDLDFLIRGYCRKGSPVEQDVNRMFTDGQKAMRATLEIRHVDGGGEREFEVIRVVAQDWVLPAQDAPPVALKPEI